MKAKPKLPELPSDAVCRPGFTQPRIGLLRLIDQGKQSDNRHEGRERIKETRTIIEAPRVPKPALTPQEATQYSALRDGWVGGDGFERQREAVKRFAKASSFDVVDEYR